MTADAQFNRWMRGALVLFIAICAYIFIADFNIPMTPHSMVQRPVVTVAPRVSGEVISVAVQNNQQVRKGDVLFKIDGTDYELAVEKARLALREAQQTNDNLHAQLAEAQASIIETQVTLAEDKREHKRLASLAAKNLVSTQLVDQKMAEVEAAGARLQAAQERKKALQVELGDEGEDNLRLRIATNTLKQAELDLARTTVVAPEDGVISNLQLSPGIQAQANQSLLSLVVTGEERVVADFREKSLSKIGNSAGALVVFDALPGEVFHASVVSKDLGVATGQLLPDGKLAEPDVSDRWVRDAQRVRVYVALTDQALPADMVSGARATVLLQRHEDGIFNWIGAAQMKVVSLLHYIY